MRTELYEPGILCCQFKEVLVALGLDMELLPGIHGKPVDDHLAEQAVVHIGAPGRAQHAVAVTLAEVAVAGDAAFVHHDAYRHNEHSGEGIDEPHVGIAQDTHQPAVHPSVAIGGSRPLVCYCAFLHTKMEWP